MMLSRDVEVAKAVGDGNGLPRYRTHLKRYFDLLLLAIISVPTLLVIAILYVGVRLDGGPGFFRHMRVGRDGQVFSCWKLRTMVVDSDRALADHFRKHPEAEDEWSRNFKLKDDPRITRLGRLLRKTSLDELPQIWNILRGEMSFVGPRPVTEPELKFYEGYEWSYVTLTPGLTGLWQVSGRNDVSYQQRIELDASYAVRCSLMVDLRILLLTFGAVLRRTGF